MAEKDFGQPDRCAKCKKRMPVEAPLAFQRPKFAVFACDKCRALIMEWWRAKYGSSKKSGDS